MSNYLLDTNVISEFRKPEKRRDPHFCHWAKSKPYDFGYLSVITLAEIHKGILLIQRKDPAQAAQIRDWLSRDILTNRQGKILSITQDIALRAAHLQVPNPMGLADALIAATALVHNMTLVTRNTSDFIDTSLPVVNPWEPNAPVRILTRSDGS